MTSRFNDGGAYCRSDRVTGNNTATAGGSGDATEVNGITVDRLTPVGMAQSAKLVINYTATLGATYGLDFSVQLQDDDGTGADWTDRGDAMTVLAATGGSGGSTEVGTVEFDVALAGCRQDIRFQITPNLSRANTDTAAWSAIAMLFGMWQGPATKAGATQRLIALDTVE